jgi:ABC-type glycerol-3-phosphate transport system substrate-binding protein
MRLPASLLSRRTFIQGAATIPLAARIQPATPDAATTPPLAGSRLSVLMPEHPLASYNDAIRSLATSWASAEGVELRLDIVGASEIPAAFSRGREAGTVHDLIGSDQPLLHLAEHLIDLEPLYAIAMERFGPAADVSNAATRLPDGTRPAFSIAYAPAPLIYRRSIWERYGLPEGPATWEQLHETGALIWNNEGMSVGLGLAPEPGSERFASMLLTAFGAALVDDEAEVALDSPEAVDAVTFAAALYRDAMSPESLDWATDRPATLLADGIVSVISGDITAYRHAQARNADIANDLFLATPPVGPAGAMFPSTPPASYRAFHIPRLGQNPDAAQAFILMLVESSKVLVGGSRLADRPSYGSLVPELVQSGGWLDNDPYGSVPPEKLAPLKSSVAWTAHTGAPGPAGPLASHASAEFLLARMLARAATGAVSPADAVAEAAERLRDLDSA